MNILCDICNGPFRKINGGWEKRVKYFIEKNGNNCKICGYVVVFDDKRIKFNCPVAASLDHIIPVKEKGCNHEKNYRVTHYYCNTVRDKFGTKDFEEGHKRKVINILKELKYIK